MTEAFFKVNLQSGQRIETRLSYFDKKINVAFRALFVFRKRSEKADAQQPEMLLEIGFFILPDSLFSQFHFSFEQGYEVKP